MKFEAIPLPYAKNALEPHISAETVEIHYEKHHKGYVEKLKSQLDGKPESNLELEELIRGTDDVDVFNNAAQIWNHDFYWRSIDPEGGGAPEGRTLEAIEGSFGSYQGFRDAFKAAATGEFGSGWAWLVIGSSGRLRVVGSSDADNPLRQNLQPLLTLDVWEHAYYVDYRNERARYVDAFLDHLVNWKFARANLEQIADAGARA
jgi:Fe-Mn family superoxide dismutase